MSASFDPYFKWLGIAPKDQPPNHYRLLGIDPFTTDRDVISNAADRQMMIIRTFQRGEHSALSQRMLNEISAAKLCLLDPATKTSYDGQLRVELSRREGPLSSPPPAAAGKVPTAKPLPNKPPPLARPLPMGPASPAEMPSPSPAAEPIVVAAKGHPYKAGRKRPGGLPPLAIAIGGGALLLLVAIVVLAISLGGGKSDKDLAAKKGVRDRVDSSDGAEKDGNSTSNSTQNTGTSTQTNNTSKSNVQWDQFGEFPWKFSDDKSVIVVSNDVRPNSWLLSKKTYGDFTLTASYRVEPKGAGGVYLRVPSDASWPWSQGLEVHFKDDWQERRSPKAEGTGAIWKKAAPWTNESRPTGQFNDVKIECRGRNLKVWINDRQVIDYDMETAIPGSGHIGLDGVSGGITYRDVRVVPLTR